MGNGSSGFCHIGDGPVSVSEIFVLRIGLKVTRIDSYSLCMERGCDAAADLHRQIEKMVPAGWIEGVLNSVEGI